MSLSHSPRIITENLVLCLDAANRKSYPGSGTTWTDLSGNGNNGTLVNGVGYNSGNGGSFSFDGSNDEVTTITQFTNPQIFSIAVWFKTSVASGNKIIGFESSQTGNGSVSYDRQIWIGTDGKLKFGIWTGNTTTVTSPLTYNDNNWHYAVGTYGGEGTTMRLYVDGISVATASGNSVSYNGYWRIAGYKSWDVSGYFPGSISVVQVYNNRALSASEIKQNYNALKSRYGLT